MAALIEFVIVVVLGTNVLSYYGAEFNVSAYAVLAALALLLLIAISHRRALPLTFDYALWLIMLGLPLILMALSSNTFGWSMWGVRIKCCLTLILGALIIRRRGLSRVIGAAALAVIAIDTATNCYEFFTGDYIWSEVSGRSAGFHINPNLSALSLVGFWVLYYFSARSVSVWREYFVLALVALGVVLTFSRGGLLLLALVAVGAILVKSGVRVIGRLSAVAAIGIVMAIGLNQLMTKRELTRDAQKRFDSLTHMTLGSDYVEERGAPALEALGVFAQDPLTGGGVNRTFQMPVGPHNMYVSVALDYGIGGLLLYLILNFRLWWIGLANLKSADASVKFTLPLCIWFTIAGFLSHNLLTDSMELMLAAFACTRSESSTKATGANRRYSTVPSPRLLAN